MSVPYDADPPRPTDPWVAGGPPAPPTASPLPVMSGRYAASVSADGGSGVDGVRGAGGSTGPEPGPRRPVRRWLVAGGAAAALAVALTLGLAGVVGHERPVASAGTATAGGPSAGVPVSSTPGDDAAAIAAAALWPPARGTAQRAFPRGADQVVVRAEPSAAAPVVATLPARTRLGSQRVLLAGPAAGGWVQVAVPGRPNGRTGWIPVSAVDLRPVPGEVVVDLAARRIRVVLGGRTVADAKVGVGSAANPTPRGTFFVTDRVAPPDPNGAYGAFALGLSGYSPTLSEFGGGDGQVGIHGTDVPSSIGRAVSHGCVRVTPEVAAVLRQVPLGTPVVIR